MSKVNSVPQTGILLLGAGGLRLNALQSNLPGITLDQQDMVNKAKKYSMEQSIKCILTKQVTPNPLQPPQQQVLQNQQQQQKCVQRHQALVLMCRVYVGSISFELREETLKAVFNPFGAIKSINMSWDPVTHKHKGFAFVEYELPEAAQFALERMNGIQISGRQIKVGRPSNLPQAAPILQQIQEVCEERNRIYVSNVHQDLFEPELAEIFDPFGKVRSCKLAVMPNAEKPQQHRGYGYIEFETSAAAIEALTMDKFDLGGQSLHVCKAITPPENLSIYGTLESESNQATVVTNSEEDIQMQLERTNEEQEKNYYDEKTSSKYSNDNNNSESLQSYEANSQQLDSIKSSEDKNHEEDVSTVLVLRNMISNDEDVDDSLQVDVFLECSKFGPVTQVVIFVDRGTAKKTEREQEETTESSTGENQVKIFVKYKQISGSKKAREALDGRFFDGRRVSAEHYDRNLFRMRDYSM